MRIRPRSRTKIETLGSLWAGLRRRFRTGNTAQLDFRSEEIAAEFFEGSSSGPDTFTLRTHGKSPLGKGDVIHVEVRE